MLGWVLGGAALWTVSAVGVARVLGAVISRADLDDPAAGAPPVRVPAPHFPTTPACRTRGPSVSGCASTRG